MLPVEFMIEKIQLIGDQGGQNAINMHNRTMNIRIKRINEENNIENNEENNVKNIQLSEFKFEIMNKKKSILEQNISVNEFRECNDNIQDFNNKITLKDKTGITYDQVITFNDFRDKIEVEGIENYYIKITLTDKEKKKYEKMVQLEQNPQIDLTKISYFEVFLKDNDNHCFNNRFILGRITYKRYILFKIEFYDNTQFIERYFFLSDLKTPISKDCKNPEQLIDKLKAYFNEQKIYLSNKNNGNSNVLYFHNNNENLEISLKEKNRGISLFYLYALIIAVCKFMRIIFQIGEFYFSIILFGIYLETTTLLITASNKFMSCQWIVLLEILIIFSIMVFINILLILPLTLQFWEFGNLRYIKEKNPFSVIIKKDDTALIDYIFEICVDSFCFIALLLYIVSLSVYNSCPEMFEVLNAISFIFLPAIKFAVLFFPIWYKGISIMIRYFHCSCCNFEEENVKKLVNFDLFQQKIDKKESAESFKELEPVQLIMYNEKTDWWFITKFIVTIICLFFILIFYPSYYLDGWTFLYLFIFFLIAFPISLAVPNNLFLISNLKECFNTLCCCDECANWKINENILKIGEKFKGLKIWIYTIQILFNLSILFLLIFVTTKNDYESRSVSVRLGNKDEFDNIIIEDFTEQTFSRNYIKSPMCFTTIHHLNFIQLTSLAQAAYLINEGDIDIAKDSFYSKSLFKDSNVQIESMEFLTRSNDNAVLLMTNITIPGSRDLIVFSIRGSYSFRDWWLDLEMYCPSTLLTMMKMIPLLQKQESFTSQVINFILTFPLRMMEGISLIKQYSDTVKSKVDPIIKKNEDKDIIFVGHSLGGGLSKYIAIHYNKQSFSVSGPGVTPLEYMNQEVSGYSNYFKSNFIDVIPDNDIVPRLEVSGGIKYRVLCNKDPVSCHSVDRTLCMIGLMCEQEETTKKLCLSMTKIQKKEYDDMKKFKNGDNFCNNYVFDKDGNANKCKKADVTSNLYKCYYVHLQYKKDNDLRNEYKCLQFTGKEKDNYEREFKSRYPEEDTIIEIS